MSFLQTSQCQEKSAGWKPKHSYLRDVSKKDAHGACEISVAQSRSPTASGPSARITASSRQMIMKNKIKHTLIRNCLSICQRKRKLDSRRRRSNRNGSGAPASKRASQESVDGKQAETFVCVEAVRPSVGRWWAESVRTIGSANNTVFPSSVSHGYLEADSAATGGASGQRGSKQRFTNPTKRRRTALGSLKNIKSVNGFPN